MHTVSLVKILWQLLKLSSGNEITDERTYDKRTDTLTTKPRYYHVAGYKKNHMKCQTIKNWENDLKLYVSKVHRCPRPIVFAHMAVPFGPTLQPHTWHEPWILYKLLHLWSLYPISNFLGQVMVPDLWFCCHFAYVQFDLLYILTSGPAQEQFYYEV